MTVQEGVAVYLIYGALTAAQGVNGNYGLRRLGWAVSLIAVLAVVLVWPLVMFFKPPKDKGP